MKTYDDKLTQALAAEKSTLDVNGVNIRVKSMPDEPRAGWLEPRELAMMQEARAAGTAGFGGPMSLEGLRQMMGFPNRNLNTIEIHTRYEEHDFEGVHVNLWVYYPRKPEGKTGRPCVLFFHGGGWVGGSTFTVENPCKLLVELADCVVINVDYPLAPEAPYPAGLNGCYAAVRHVYENADAYGIDKEKIAVAGDSAGGNYAAVCALRDRDDGAHRIKLQMLIYPAVTLAANTPGYEWSIDAYEIADAMRPILAPAMSAMAGTSSPDNPMLLMYLGNPALADDPHVSPLLAKSFRGLCKALIVTPEFDGLRLQGEVYAKVLQDAGVPVQLIRYKGQMHAFLDKLGVVPQAEDLVREMAALTLEM